MDALASLSSLLGDMMNFLETSASDPLSFSIIMFLYTILAAVFLPIPVEVSLFFSPETPVAVKILIMGLGKMFGSMLVFSIGLKVGDSVKAWSADWKLFGSMVHCCEWMVNRFHYLGLYLILSLPLMTDTVPLYVFSMFNERGVLNIKWFALASLLAGITRGLIVFMAFYAMGVKLV